MEEKLKKALKSKRVVEHEGFLRFSEKVGGVPRGTVVIGERVVPGYPKIKRVFVLGKGVGRNISSPEFIAEEKIDGYNIRAVLHEGKLYCFSRGGYADYFAKEKLMEEKAAWKFFAEKPGWVLCGEMAGNTPHTPPTDEYDVRFFVFDIIDERGEFTPPLERREICRKYGLASVPLIGRFRRGEIGKLREAARKLDREGKEGMVLRGLGAEREIIKHVTPSSDINDLMENSAQIFDMPSGFMKQRVFRSAVSLRELGLGKERYVRVLGEALYSGLLDALAEGRVEEKYRIRVRDLRTWDRILGGMGKEVEIRVNGNKKKGGFYEINFTKMHKEGTRRMRRALEGHPQED
ncbi:MAG: RNA ligase [Candidatus Micrarchaeota archaeon]